MQTTVQKKKPLLLAGPIEIDDNREIVHVRITNPRARMCETLQFLILENGRLNTGALPVRALKEMMPGMDTMSRALELMPILESINEQLEYEYENEKKSMSKSRIEVFRI
jgi:hypothetical protein